VKRLLVEATEWRVRADAISGKEKMVEDDLDAIDRRIVAALLADGRMSVTALAAAVGLSKTPVQLRLNRLLKAGVIRGFHATVDRRLFGGDHVAFVEVKLSDTRERALAAFNAAVLRIPEIEECHMIASRFDYLLKVRTQDIREYRQVLGERISSLPHVASTSTFVAMETVRD
jgi:Lrp/AsnC family transcriptional regulator, leucine-responsive regulatory protein